MSIVKKVKDLGRRVLGSRTVAYAAPYLTASAAALGSKDARENLTRAYGGIAVGAARLYGGDAGAQAANAALVAVGGKDQLAPALAPTVTEGPATAYATLAQPQSSPLGWILGAAVALVGLVLVVLSARRLKS